jgi:hypothetical protein
MMNPEVIMTIKTNYRYAVLVCVFAALTGYLAAQERGIAVVAAEAVGRDASIGKQWAVFIAIDRYLEWNPLNNPVKDAKEIRDILTQSYFIDEVRELYDRDATAANIRRLFSNLRQESANNDSVFVFYAGHGYTDDMTNTGFWIPADAGNDTYAQTNWLPNIQIRNMLAMLPAKHVFLVSDACFSGDILDTNRGATPVINSDYFRRAYSRVSRQVMTSGASESVPDTSEFALRLKSTLRRAEGLCIDPEYIFNNVKEVRSTHPLLGVIRNGEHQDGGSFLFFRRASLPSSTVEAPQPDWTPASEFELALGEEGVTITKYKGKAETVSIPAVIDGSPVVAIGEGAFEDCWGLTSITIPNGVTEIGDRAFYCCTGLTSITIPNGVTAIGDDAFSVCIGLSSITIPTSVTAIGDRAFRSCNGLTLTSITIPASVIEIGDLAFGSCWSLTSITVDARNTRFSSVNGILFSKDGKTLLCYPAGKTYTSYTIPTSVTAIGDWAFEDCWGLTSITIPTSVTAIGQGAFRECSGLTSITIPTSVTAIGSEAFSGCSGLTSITIPTSVTSIETQAFRECSGLTSITIPTSVTEIGREAFSGCNGLTSITISTSVTEIGYAAFEDCSGLSAASREAIRGRFGDGVF